MAAADGAMTTSRADRLTMADAITRALAEELAADERVLVMGEDVGALGGVFRITAGLQDRFGEQRVFDTPLAEAGLIGTAIGLALSGLRPVVEIQFDGFLYPAINQVVAHLARLPARLEEPDALPVTVRLPVGGRIRAAEMHSESPETFLVHSPDLRVVAASIPETAGALLRAAIRSDQPTFYLEPKRQYRRRRIAERDVIAEVDPTAARRVRTGDGPVIIAYGPGLDLALDAADALASEGVEASVLDLVSLAPLDTETILEAVAAAGQVVVVTEAPQPCSVGSEVVALIATQAFASLRAAPRLVASPARPYPVADQEGDFFPTVSKVVAAVKEVLA